MKEIMKTVSRRPLVTIAACTHLAMLPIAEAGEISFSDVLGDPSNLELNYDYAVQEVAAGDYISAAAALERVLMVDPSWHEARLLYAIVLYRMDDMQSSSTELKKLEKIQFEPTTQADYQYYVDRVRDSQSKSEFNGQLVVGLAYDDTVLGTLNNLGGFASAKSDASATISGRLSWRREMSDSKNLDFVANLRGFTKQYLDVSSLSYATVQADAGFEGGVGRYDWKAMGVARAAIVNGNRYLNTIGVRGQVMRKLSGRTFIGVSLSYDDLNYDNIRVNGSRTFAETARSGDEVAGKVVFGHRFNPDNAIKVGVGYLERDAKANAFSYDGVIADATYAREWGKGIYSDFEYGFQERNHKGFATREDKLHYVRASLGAPLRKIFSGGSDASLKQLEDLSVETSIYHERRESNVNFFEYDNTGVDMRLVWGFGK